MQSKKRVTAMVLTVVFLCLLLYTTAFAVSEDEVEQAVSTLGRESVAGNLFIWFLCAIAFLKISQKIDSFMASLGVNVGRAGGSMMAELMIAMRTLAPGKGFFSGFGNRGASGSNGSTGTNSGSESGGGSSGFMSGGLIGVASRKLQGGTAAGAANQPSSGVIGNVGSKAFSSSLSKGGDLAMSAVSKIAHGNITKSGSITGEKAATAMQSYFPSVANNNMQNTVQNGAKASTQFEGDTISVSQTDNNTETLSSPSFAPNESIPSSPQTASVVEYTNVEIGGGRITGFESSGMENSVPQQFAMYSADQYITPSNHYEMVTAIDDSKWYKQYAQATVERTPYQASDGGVSYNETIVQHMPPMPRRKDKV